MSTAEERLAELGLTLPTDTAPLATYVPAVRTGNLLYLAGKGPFSDDGSGFHGKVGADLSVEDAYKHARAVGVTVESRDRGVSSWT